MDHAVTTNQVPIVTQIYKNKRYVLKNIGVCLTMELPQDSAHLDPASPKWLGMRKNVDILIEKGFITSILPSASSQGNDTTLESIDCSGMVCVPGLVDCHNHPIFSGSRSVETIQKSQGMTYEEISKQGGGIAVTMAATRSASDAELRTTFVRHASQALHRGVVLLEAKTGYGLHPKEELRLLQCIYAAYDNAKDPLPFCSPTYMPLHAASPEFHGLETYLNACIESLPAAQALSKSNTSSHKFYPLATDIFVERGFFTKELADKWLSAAIGYGLNVHIHSDEFSRSGGTESAVLLASKLEQNEHLPHRFPRVLSVDHCQYATETDLAKLKQLGVTAVLLPCTSFFSQIPFVDAKRMRGSGIPIAIGTDFNPGSSPFNNLFFASYLALSKCGLSLAEVYRGITTHAANALGVGGDFGQIAPGRPAHLVLFKGTQPEDLVAFPMGDHLQRVFISEQKHATNI
jgi:imidazolonepropionase